MLTDEPIRRPRISRDETLALLRRWRASRETDTPDHAARNAAVEGHLGLVGHCLHWARRVGLPTAHDAREEAYLDLVKAATEFDPDRGLQFNTYAVRAIRNGMLNRRGHISIVRTPRDHQNAQGGPFPANYLHAKSVASLDALPEYGWLACREPGPVAVAERRDEAAVLDRHIGTLIDPRARRVVRDRVAGATFEAIGRDLGVTREYARQVYAQAFQMLTRGADRSGPRASLDPARVLLLDAVARVLEAGEAPSLRSVARHARRSNHTIARAIANDYPGGMPQLVAEARDRAAQQRRIA